MEKLVIKNLFVGGECNLFHRGVVIDSFKEGPLEFYQGNLYGFVGEFGTGGAALSCGLTGNTNFYQGKIFMDDKEISIDELIKNSWYIGNDLYSNKKKRFFKRKPQRNRDTIKDQIEYGLDKYKMDYDFYTVQRMFNVSNERVIRNIEFVSGERWKASAAIGFANEKKIFCYPWLNTWDIDLFGEQMSGTVETLLNHGCIVILPTTKEENIEKISSKGHIMQVGQGKMLY